MEQINGLPKLLDSIEDNIEQLQKQPNVLYGVSCFQDVGPIKKEGAEISKAD